MNWLESKGVEVLPWPGSSPDMNPIENLWHCWKKEMLNLPHPKNLGELERMMKLTWKRLSRKTRILQNLTDSAANRVAALWESQGEGTRY